MNHSNNYFQKGVVILVATMLLTIQSLRVYSSVGSYQLSSQAVDANNYYNIHTEKKGFRNLPAVASVVLTGAIIIVSIAASVSVSQLNDEDYVDYEYGDFIINPALEHNSLNENYAKYDFSEFDN